MASWMTIGLAVLVGCASAGPSMHDPAHPLQGRGHDFGDVLFPAPASDENASYLGLSPTEEPFRIRQVRARVLVVEIFDMYCIHCQRAAPEVNGFYEMVEQTGLADRVKIVGLGRRNSGIEVEVFKDRYRIEFPLFPDPELSVTESLEARAVGTPSFLVFDLQDGGGARMVDSTQGSFGTPEAFLKRVRRYLQEE